ncbi:hypothetical protein ACHMW6_16540 [Pseudoduganella sp. UC29_106]|uniref:hypothetical protein n=1 Tax=Pseudoduganella sp. UC29_106 TaxID=3374553 RepID=UPI003756AF6B
MNIQKHMELIFVSVLTILGVGTLAMENLPKAFAKAKPAVANDIGTPTNMAVVVIRAPRGKA